jgi:hypothetical protein
MSEVDVSKKDKFDSSYLDFFKLRSEGKITLKASLPNQTLVLIYSLLQARRKRLPRRSKSWILFRNHLKMRSPLLPSSQKITMMEISLPTKASVARSLFLLHLRATISATSRKVRSL